MKVQVINLSNNKLPQYETPMSAGMDIRADFSRVTVDNPIKAKAEWEEVARLDETERKGGFGHTGEK